jgi:hypothetical protein
MRARALVVASIVTLLAVSYACSSSDTSSNGPSGLDENKRVADLSPDELGRLCDAYVAANGGYGTTRSVTCGGTKVNLPNPKDQAECIGRSKVPATCGATVKQFEDCQAGLKNDPCNAKGIASCAFLFDPTCSSSGADAGPDSTSLDAFPDGPPADDAPFPDGPPPDDASFPDGPPPDDAHP